MSRWVQSGKWGGKRRESSVLRRRSLVLRWGKGNIQSVPDWMGVSLCRLRFLAGFRVVMFVRVRRNRARSSVSSTWHRQHSLILWMCALLFVSFLCRVHALDTKNKVTSLPTFGRVREEQYAGYGSCVFLWLSVVVVVFLVQWERGIRSIVFFFFFFFFLSLLLVVVTVFDVSRFSMHPFLHLLSSWGGSSSW